jgi:hypothetical protein
MYVCIFSLFVCIVYVCVYICVCVCMYESVGIYLH